MTLSPGPGWRCPRRNCPSLARNRSFRKNRFGVGFHTSSVRLRTPQGLRDRPFTPGEPARTQPVVPGFRVSMSAILDIGAGASIRLLGTRAKCATGLSSKGGIQQIVSAMRYRGKCERLARQLRLSSSWHLQAVRGRPALRPRSPARYMTGLPIVFEERIPSPIFN